MEVGLPPVPMAQQGFNFGDLEVLTGELDENQVGSYSTKFVQFLSDEKSQLRLQFVDPSHPNVDAYADIFDASSDMIESTLEHVWCTNYEWGSFQKRLDQLEHDMNDIEAACEDFQRDWDGLSWWKKTLEWNLDGKMSRKLISRKKILDAMYLECIALSKDELDVDGIRSITSKQNENRRMIEREEQTQWGIGEDLLSELRVLLLHRLNTALLEMLQECFSARVSAVKRIWEIRKRIMQKWAWALEIAVECTSTSLKVRSGVLGLRLVLNMFNLDTLPIEKEKEILLRLLDLEFHDQISVTKMITSNFIV